MKTTALHIALLACLLPLASAAQTPAQLKSWLPTVEGWTISENAEVFNPENLFNRINGAAPLYIENNFREMTSLEYTRGDTYITIQAYRHATPEDAFGMYAAERSPDLTAYPIGGEAQGDDASLSFFAASIYVKMWSNGEDNPGETIREIATALARAIDPSPGYPAPLRAFPAAGKAPCSEAYTTANFLGHEFLKNVYSATYRRDGGQYQLFLVDAPDAAAARAILEKYFAFTKQQDPLAEGELLVKDRYNGEIPLLWRGSRVAGVFADAPLPDARDILKGLLDALP
ncbi:MAG: hypothetical protein LBI96_06760 [Odoribacteraceae bacterium]|jgi:hypothetical protein|nr:hypothetical protein [Odoribacteraceae bacterium]